MLDKKYYDKYWEKSIDVYISVASATHSVLNLQLLSHLKFSKEPI